MEYNNIIINFVIHKPFHVKNTHRAVTITIRNYEMKSYLNIKYSELISLFEPLGFDKSIIWFPNLKDDTLLYVKIDDVRKTEVSNFIQNKLKDITNQKHYINIKYGLRFSNISFNNLDNVLNRQINDSLFLHNPFNYAQLKYTPKGDETNFDRLFFGKEYILTMKKDSIIYINIIRGICETVIFKEWLNNKLSFSFMTKNTQLIKEMRTYKLNNIFKDEKI